MSWQLRVYTPTGGPHIPGTQIASYDPDSPGGIVEGFRWSCSPHGDCLQMEFTAVPRLVDIPPRAIVQLLIDGNPAFYGFVTRSWPPTAGQAEGYVALGASQLLRQRYVDIVIKTPQDIAQIVHTVMQSSHPSIGHNLPPPNTGYTLHTFKAPRVDIASILKNLSGAAGVAYGVRADGNFFFQNSTSTSSVSYVHANVRYLPVNESEVVDTVHLFHPETGYTYTYHSGLGYGLGKTVSVPQMHNYMDRASDTLDADFSYPYAPGDSLTDLDGDPTYPLWGPIYDDDQTTGYILTYNPPPGEVCTEYRGLRGVEFFFAAAPGLAVVWRVQARQLSLESPNYPQSQGLGLNLYYKTRSGVYDKTSGVVSGHAVLSPDAQPSSWGILTVGARQTTECTPYRFALYQFAVYTPGPLLARLAESLIRVPYHTPSEVRTPGYIPPTTHLTILGTPSGDVTGPVARWEYVYTVRDGIISVANVGQPNISAEAEAIQMLATQISAEGETRTRW